jgi:allophanate hydrolase subunit 1
MSAPGQPHVLPCGDAAVTVEFGREIAAAVNALALDARLTGIPGVLEAGSTYRSLPVVYDPDALDYVARKTALIGRAGERGP